MGMPMNAVRKYGYAGALKRWQEARFGDAPKPSARHADEIYCLSGGNEEKYSLNCQSRDTCMRMYRSTAETWSLCVGGRDIKVNREDLIAISTRINDAIAGQKVGYGVQSGDPGFLSIRPYDINVRSLTLNGGYGNYVGVFVDKCGLSALRDKIDAVLKEGSIEEDS